MEELNARIDEAETFVSFVYPEGIGSEEWGDKWVPNDDDASTGLFFPYWKIIFALLGNVFFPIG